MLKFIYRSVQISAMYKEASEELKSRFPQDPKPIGVGIASVLKGLLEGRNIQRLAQEAGISRVEIYHILSERKKYPGLENLQKLARLLGMELWQLAALAQGKQGGNLYFGSPEPEFTMQFKKAGVLFSSDIPPHQELFVGRLVLDPGAELSDRLVKDCLIYLRPISTSVEVTFERETRTLHVNEKAFFNGRFHHTLKNPSKVKKSTALLITTPAFWSLNWTK